MMPKSYPHDPAEQSHPSVSFPSGISQEERGIRARLLLKLIDNGTIPSQPDHFVQELNKLAAQALPESQPASDELLKALQRQFQKHQSRAEHAPPPSSPATDKQTQPNSPTGDKGCATADKGTADQCAEPEDLDELHEQHPAVICKQLQMLEVEDLNQRFKTLPGQTARQVAFLLWQDS